jgi:hypothetical protein
VQPGPHLLFLPAKEMLHPGSRFQMAGDLLETYLLWLIEAHAHASEAGRVRSGPGHAECPDRYAPSAQPSHRVATHIEASCAPSA